MQCWGDAVRRCEDAVLEGCGQKMGGCSVGVAHSEGEDDELM